MSLVRLRRFIALAAVMAVLVTTLPSQPTAAALFTYRLIGGVQNRHYWIDPAMINPVYGTLSRNAVASWNNTPTPVYFTETTSQCCDSQTDFYAKDYGNIGWDGATVFRDGSGNSVCCVGGAPFANWNFSEVSLNDYYLKTYVLSATSQGVAAHEFGHSVALGHSSLTTALMTPNTSDRIANGQYTPQQNDDIAFASQLSPNSP